MKASNKARLEAILFAYGDEGVESQALKNSLNLDSQEFTLMMESYKKSLDSDINRGFKLVKYADRYKLSTKKEFYEDIANLLNFQTKRQLSQAALETLAIIAYRQPITRLEIEEIRGVNSDMMCRRLEAMDLIREMGRAETAGKPILYEVTERFMDVFSLEDLDELPEIKIETMDDNNELFK